MKNEVMLQIAEAALEIGASSKHFVTVDLSLHKGAFPVVVYIHKLNEIDISDGVEDSLDFSTDASFELHKGWFEKWAKIIAKERLKDEVNKS